VQAAAELQSQDVQTLLEERGHSIPPVVDAGVIDDAAQ
jgi:hypothetical protein